MLVGSLQHMFIKSCACCLQAEARRLEQLAGMAATDPFAGMATPGSMHTTSGGSLHAGAGRYASVSANSGSNASAHSGYPSRMASLNAAGSSYGPSAPLSGTDSLAADPDAIQALNHRLASLQRSGGSGEDREAVVDLLQRVLSGGLVRALALPASDVGSFEPVLLPVRDHCEACRHVRASE